MPSGKTISDNEFEYIMGRKYSFQTTTANKIRTWEEMARVRGEKLSERFRACLKKRNDKPIDFAEYLRGCISFKTVIWTPQQLHQMYPNK